jgi:hypothetical protein
MLLKPPRRSLAGGVNGSLLDPVITLGELHAGVLLARSGRTRELRRRRLEAIRAVFVPLPVDEAVAERYGDVLALARSQRRAVKATDVLILATAAATSRTLYTLDIGQTQLARAADVAVEAL